MLRKLVDHVEVVEKLQLLTKQKKLLLLNNLILLILHFKARFFSETGFFYATEFWMRNVCIIVHRAQNNTVL
jgi:hypothetical protein